MSNPYALHGLPKGRSLLAGLPRMRAGSKKKSASETPTPYFSLQRKDGTLSGSKVVLKDALYYAYAVADSGGVVQVIDRYDTSGKIIQSVKATPVFPSSIGVGIAANSAGYMATVYNDPTTGYPVVSVLSPQGSLVWSKRLSSSSFTSSNIAGSRVVLDEAGNLIVVIAANSGSSVTPYQSFLYKFSLAGVQLWVMRCGADYGIGLWVAPSGAIYTHHRRIMSSSSGTWMYLTRYNPETGAAIKQMRIAYSSNAVSLNALSFGENSDIYMMPTAGSSNAPIWVLTPDMVYKKSMAVKMSGGNILNERFTKMEVLDDRVILYGGSNSSTDSEYSSWIAEYDLGLEQLRYSGRLNLPYPTNSGLEISRFGDSIMMTNQIMAKKRPKDFSAYPSINGDRFTNVATAFDYNFMNQGTVLEGIEDGPSSNLVYSLTWSPFTYSTEKRDIEVQTVVSTSTVYRGIVNSPLVY